MMRRSFYLTIFVLLSIQFVLARDFRQTVKKNLASEGIRKVEVFTTNGSIILKGWDKDSIAITAHKKVDTSPTDANKILNNIDLITARKGATLVVKAESHEKSSKNLLDWLLGLGIRNFQVDIEISVPRNLEIALNTTNGQLEVEDISGKLDLSTTNGDINVLRASNLSEIHSTNGSVYVHYRSLPEHGHIKISTTNGKIKCILPPQAKCSITAYTNNGEIMNVLPNAKVKMVSKRSLEAKCNGGGVEIDVRTTNGEISLMSK